MLWTIIGILLLAWLVGTIFDIGSFIHALLVVALIILIVKLIRRS
ncbi:lmo0937 family membrane protein [Priestia megaterium]|nr:lmo0937 family membrane protein [Priestia megaterium]